MIQIEHTPSIVSKPPPFQFQFLTGGGGFFLSFGFWGFASAAAGAETIYHCSRSLGEVANVHYIMDETDAIGGVEYDEYSL